MVVGAESEVGEPGWDPGHSCTGQVWPGTVFRHRQGILLFLPPTLRTAGVDPKISCSIEMMSQTFAASTPELSGEASLGVTLPSSPLC